jgi:hypothetical protein
MLEAAPIYEVLGLPPSHQFGPSSDEATPNAPVGSVIYEQRWGVHFYLVHLSRIASLTLINDVMQDLSASSWLWLCS